MFNSIRHLRCSSIFCFLFFCASIQIPLIASQSCERNLSEYLYPVNYIGPFFSQAVYALKVSVCTLSSDNSRSLLNFNVYPQTIDIWPVWSNSTGSYQVFNASVNDITVTTNHSNFKVDTYSNSSFSLVKTTTSFKYYIPYHRYLFELIATQRILNRPSLVSRALVQIDLINGNANPPQFLFTNQKFYISETADIGTQFGTVYANDPDNDEIYYWTNSSQFSIDLKTGVLELQQKFHPQSQSIYTVEVTIADYYFSPPSSETQCQGNKTRGTIIIVVTAVNKNSPRFLSPSCGSTLKFEESNQTEQIIAKLKVFDDDRDENGEITISVPSEESRTAINGYKNMAYTQFYIEPLQQTNSVRYAWLRANRSFDYDKLDAIRVWHLSILATDRGKQPRNSFCTFRIELIDVNDNHPVFAMSSWNYTIYRSEFENTNKRNLFRIIASDADSGYNGMINYYISTHGVPYFTINRTTGVIQLQSHLMDVSSLDPKKFPIRFEVYAKDRGVPALVSQHNATVTIHYGMMSDTPSARWLDPRYEQLDIYIHEKFYERYPDRPIFDYGAQFNGSIIYELPSSASSLLTVSNPFSSNSNVPFKDAALMRSGNIFTSGILVTSGLHAEIRQNYFLYLRVLVHPPLIGSMNIHLIDENDQSPMFDIRTVVLSVVEKEIGMRVLGQVQAYDRDINPNYNRVTYSLYEPLSDPMAIGKFFVTDDGTIWTNRSFDRDEDPPPYRIFIRASDSAPAWNSATERNFQDFQFDIQLIRVNARSPDISGNSMNTIDISETISSGEGIGNFSITDLDTDTVVNLGIRSGNERNAFTFTVLTDNSDDPMREKYEAIGQLKVVGPIDCQIRTEYQLILFVFDAQNTQYINVTIRVNCQNTKPPKFQHIPDPTGLHFEVTERTQAILHGHNIEAFDPDVQTTPIVYEIDEINRQVDLKYVKLDSHIRVNLPGLSRDLPLGYPIYNFSVRATDENGTGLFSYLPVRIQVNRDEERGPMVLSPSFTMYEGENNPTVPIMFIDPNDTPPYILDVVDPLSFSIFPRITFSKHATLTYYGVLNRTTTKSLIVTLQITDNRNRSRTSRIRVTVGDRLDNLTPISDAEKTINVVYIDDYENSLRNVVLGSIFVEDVDDWFREERTYSIDGDSIFDVSHGLLRTSQLLNSTSYRLDVHVTKPTNPPSRAVSHIDLQVSTVDIESVQQAAVVRIEGQSLEMILSSLPKLVHGLAFVLPVSISNIKILSIRPAFIYRNALDLLLTSDETRKDLFDVYVSAFPLTPAKIETKIKENLSLFPSRFGITVNDSGPDPCIDYPCPYRTSCQSVRTIQPGPVGIDTNRTSFVGIYVFDIPYCINANSSVRPIVNPSGCDATEPLGPLGRYCQVLGLVFDEHQGGYAQFSGENFSNLAPGHFSFDFTATQPEINSILLLYGRDRPPVDDFFWMAIKLSNSQLEFHFRNHSPLIHPTKITPSTFYHIECQFVDSMVIVSINDCQHKINVSRPLNDDDLSRVYLYLGGLPMNENVISAMYSSLTDSRPFRGCIRNVLSNGIHLDMSRSIFSQNSIPGPCQRFQRIETQLRVPWFTWLIIVLVLLVLLTIVALTLLNFTRKREKLQILTQLYVDDTRENIIDYKETAGEEDHRSYDLHVLKKPAVRHHVDELLVNDRQFSFSNPNLIELTENQRVALGDYIDQQVQEHQPISYVNDVSLRYRYEGETSFVSDLSSIASNSTVDVNFARLFRSLGPKFATLADLYSVEQNEEEFF